MALTEEKKEEVRQFALEKIIEMINHNHADEVSHNVLDAIRKSKYNEFIQGDKSDAFIYEYFYGLVRQGILYLEISSTDVRVKLASNAKNFVINGTILSSDLSTYKKDYPFFSNILSNYVCKDDVEFYFLECLKSYHNGCFASTIICLGICSELILTELASKKSIGPNKPAVLINSLRDFVMPHDKLLAYEFYNYATLFREGRNDEVHIKFGYPDLQKCNFLIKHFLLKLEIIDKIEKLS
ncbi:MAG: hypothetical protein Q7S92_00455 [Candidatus Diapherotrites archaeon]|nr:hypothetical protein [Candidatus Diapherotrites archaeon]